MYSASPRVMLYLAYQVVLIFYVGNPTRLGSESIMVLHIIHNLLVGGFYIHVLTSDTSMRGAVIINTTATQHILFFPFIPIWRSICL